VPLRSEGFEVELGPDWYLVPDQLDQENDRAEELLGIALRDAMAPILADVRQEALQLPSHGTKHTGLRARLAAGVDTEQYGKSRIRVVARAEPGEEALPRGMDSGIRGWRHPVYGNKEVWVTQRGGSWFREPIAEHGEFIERQLGDVVDHMAERVAVRGLAP
jgi:hypothetical protein